MSRKSKTQETEASEEYPELAQDESQERLGLTTTEGQIIDLTEESGKEGSAMNGKSEENGLICPVCKSGTLSVAGKGKGGTKFLVCTSEACRKPPFNFTLFYAPSNRAPVLWMLEIGAIHQINGNETPLS